MKEQDAFSSSSSIVKFYLLQDYLLSPEGFQSATNLIQSIETEALSSPLIQSQIPIEV
eukprot:21915_1